MKGKNGYVIAIGCVILAMLATTVGVWRYYQHVIRQGDMAVADETVTYQRHYALVVEDNDSLFWQSVYETARETAMKQGALLEMLGSSSLAGYTQEDMLKVCIAESVDGILLQYKESAKMDELMDEAVEKGIPVVTVLEDDSQRRRKSYIGVDIYQLAEVYGQQVTALVTENTKKIMVFASNSDDRNSQKQILAQIQNAVTHKTRNSQDINFEMKTVDSMSAFDSEETVRNIILSDEDAPDILVCLDEADTECAYQAIIDYNDVGKLAIVGYYRTPLVLEGIQKEIIPVTVELDAGQMGRLSVQALTEYIKEGRVSDYYSVNVHVITSENVEEYMDE